MNIVNSFIITSFAGLSTIIGYFFVYLKGDINKLISLFLSIAAGVMCTISFSDLIPSSFNYFSNYYLLFRLLILIFLIILGFVVSNFISYCTDKYDNNSLTKLGILSLISIIVHNVFEGMLTFISCQIDLNLGIYMAFSISLHNIPEGISIAIPLYYANKSQKKIFFVIVIAGFSELFGAFFAYIFLMQFVNNLLLGIMLAITAGIMINIGFFNLYKEARGYNKKISFIGLIIGILIMIISMIFI